MILPLPECRFCNHKLQQSFCNLGTTPFSNAYLSQEELEKEELFFPLHAFVCHHCFLVQLQEFQKPELIFSEYAYFSSYSESWLQHAQHYVDSVTQRFSLSAKSRVIEIASNDGYLLQYFKAKRIPILGIEPAENVAEVAINKGIPTLVKFFSTSLAHELISKDERAHLILGNNVLAHVPDLNDFIKGMKILLREDGIITMEFPHVLQLVKSNQFDTIYHEHFSYFSFITVEKIFAHHGLKLFDVEELSTHGGSLRIFACHDTDYTQSVTDRVQALKEEEIHQGLDTLDYYQNFNDQVQRVKQEIQAFFLKAKREGKVIMGYGAPAKGNTLLNFCNIGPDLLKFTVDRNPYKQNKYLPGTHIPIKNVESIASEKPDYLFILPWNIKEEIMQQMSFIRRWGGKFIIPIPKLEVVL